MTSPLFESTQDIANFEHRIASRALGKRIQFFNRTQSTNDLALDAARGQGAHGTVFVADEQDAGRGRRGRTWNCPPAMGLLLSVLVRPRTIPLEASGWIPLVAGLACAEALASFSEHLSGVTVKWPNDIVVPCDVAPGWKKLGGILCESALSALSSEATLADLERGYAVIGIGLNINQTQAMLPETDKAPPTSLLLETGKSSDRQAVLQAILERLEFHLDALSDSSRRSALRFAIEEKMRAWLPESKQLTFRLPPFDAPNPNEHVGTFAGLDTFGRLRLRSVHDHVETVYADAEIIAVQS